MTPIEVISLLSTIASLIFAVLAIWLSIVFYRLSITASKATEDVTKGISASVERLEKIFDKLYSDTFSVMRETVTDMRKHILDAPASSVENQIRLVKNIERNPNDEEAKFSLIDSMCDVVEAQMVILAHLCGKDIPRHISYVYEFEDHRAGSGSLGGFARENRLEGTGVFESTGSGRYYRLSPEGRRFAEWLIKKGRKALYFWTPIESWGTPKPGGFAEKEMQRNKGDKNAQPAVVDNAVQTPISSIAQGPHV
jgi:hypothetical protein